MAGSESGAANEEAMGFFVSRQPIVAGERRIVGWELSFGSEEGLPLVGEECSTQSVAAVAECAETANWDSLLCGGRLFLPVDRRLIFSEVIEALPRNRVVLGLPRMDEVDPNLSRRLHDLNALHGVRLLFQEYTRRDPREQLLDLADAVQIDAFGLDPEACGLLLRRAHRRNLQVLATSVDAQADFVRIRDSGFELFAGRSYSEHAADGATRATPDGQELLQLIIDARGEFELDSVRRQIEASPSLAGGLLRIVNSLGLSLAQKIETVSQALVMIGTNGLSRWLNLLLFQTGSRHGTSGPLFRVAASRARLMELLVGAGVPGASAELKARGEVAFLVGILSLVHVLLGVDREAAVLDLAMPEEMGEALLGYGGELGRMLRLSECLDAGQFVEAAQLAKELDLSPAMIWEHQCRAYDWVAQTI